jgi:hypothetical protein
MMRWRHYNFGGRAFWVRPVNLDVLQANNVVAATLGKPLPWAVGFFFGDLELSDDPTWPEGIGGVEWMIERGPDV